MFAEPPLTSQDKKPIVFGLPKMREKVLDMLGSAYSNNDLDIEEYEKRLAAAHKAQSIDELEHVIYDFPAVRTLFPTKPTNTPTFPNRINTDFTTSTRFNTSLANLNSDSSFINIIGNKEISSLDISEPSIELITGIGDTMLDLRDIGKKYTHIKITNYTLIGNLRIKLPANAQLKKGMSIAIGNLTQKVRGEGFWNGLLKRIVKEVPQISTPNPNPPIFVELSGFSLIGEVIVEYEKE